MANNSKIEWTESTWNPVTGCTKVSAGCKNCYAERMALRLQAMGVERYRDGFAVRIHKDLLDRPLSWRRPKIVFVNSMSDLFHEDVPVNFIRSVFETMSACPQHTFQVLTKRSERLRQIADELTWPSNVWMGVSVENSDSMQRIEDLRRVPSVIRFISCEPLIGDLSNMSLDGLDWVIVGGESGPGARPMRREWVETIYQECSSSQVPFFFKQWGGTRKHLTGREFRGTTFDEMPSHPRVQLPIRWAPTYGTHLFQSR